MDWIYIAAVAAALSAACIVAHRVGGRAAMAIPTVAALLLVEVAVLRQRAHASIDPLRAWEEPLWFTVLVAGIPVVLTGAALAWTSGRRWPAAVQLIAGTAAGVALFVATMFGFYVVLVTAG